jgi:serine/threonine protein kinase
MENQSIRDPYKLVGTTLKRYQIQGLVGIGGMGAVYRAQHEITRAIVAVKVLRPDLWMGDQESLSFFFAEATKTVALNHPSIIKVNDADITEDGLAFMVMDLLDGRTLETELKENGSISLERANALLEQICDAVAYAHNKNVVHRDLKPGNIMLVQEENGEETLRILDFGIAKILSASSRTNTRIFGSSYYVSPEQTMANGRIDRATDIYSLGVTLYEMLTGKVPFEGETEAQVIDMHRSHAPRPLREIHPEIPQAVEDVVLRAMAKNPKDRFQSAILFARAFQKAVNFAPGALELRCIDLDSGEDIQSAMIYLNGRLAGQAQNGSWHQENLIPRKYLIEVEAPNYINWHRTVSLDSHEKLALVVELEREGAAQLLATREAAQLNAEIEGAELEIAEATLSLEAVATDGVTNNFVNDSIDTVDRIGRIDTVLDKAADNLSGDAIEFVSIQPLPIDEKQISEVRTGSAVDSMDGILVADEFRLDGPHLKPQKKKVESEPNLFIKEHPQIIKELPRNIGKGTYTPLLDTPPPPTDEAPTTLRQRIHRIVLVVGAGLFIVAAYAFLIWLYYARPKKEAVEITTYLSNCRVVIDNKLEYLTDDQGKITISGLEKGEHTIKVSKPGYKDLVQEITIPLEKPLPPLIPGVIIPNDMVFIPGGTFMMGRGKGTDDNPSGPAHEVTIAPFFIDKHEVTREAYLKFIKATGYHAPSEWKTGTYPYGTGKLPVTGVSWEDAQTYAKWAGKRLPTEAEWEFAARGFDKRIYPWGNKFAPEKANVAREPAQLTKVETYPTGVSPFGAYDMAGNAWEWTDSEFKPYPGSAFRVDGCSRCKVLRGGSYVNRPEYATAFYRLPYEASLVADPNIYYGFRCAQSTASQ